MPDPLGKTETDTTYKVPIVCGIGMGIGFGTCGLALSWSRVQSTGTPYKILMGFLIVGAGLFALSFAGLISRGLFVAIVRLFHKC